MNIFVMPSPEFAYEASTGNFVFQLVVMFM